jgi:hypothetical protein
MLIHIRVIIALAHVDMVVRVNRLLGAKLTAQNLYRTVRNYLLMSQCQYYTQAGIFPIYFLSILSHAYLVDIHVTLHPTTHLEGKVVDKLENNDLQAQTNQPESEAQTNGSRGIPEKHE